MTYFQAVVIALIQGVTEMFPISSLGHSVNGYRGQAGRMPFAWMAGLKPPVI